MPFTLQPAGEELELSLTGRVGVQDARPLWESLQEVLFDNTVVRLKASNLEEMDTSIVQILCRISVLPGKLRVAALSDGFVLSLQRRGLANLFIDPPRQKAPVVLLNASGMSEAPHEAQAVEGRYPADETYPDRR